MTPSAIATARWRGISSAASSGQVSEIACGRMPALSSSPKSYDGLGFFADFLLGDDPEAEKQRLRDGFARLATEVDFDHLLLAHGTPILGDGREQLSRFAAG